jgi:hypothetical protein
MEQSSRTVGQTTDEYVVLKQLQEEQKNFHEGSFEWVDIQSKINRIVAQNFLEYVNR